MQYDLNKQIEMCKNLQRKEERTNKGIVSLILFYILIINLIETKI